MRYWARRIGDDGVSLTQQAQHQRPRPLRRSTTQAEREDLRVVAAGHGHRRRSIRQSRLPELRAETIQKAGGEIAVVRGRHRDSVVSASIPEASRRFKAKGSGQRNFESRTGHAMICRYA